MFIYFKLLPRNFSMIYGPSLKGVYMRTKNLVVSLLCTIGFSFIGASASAAIHRHPSDNLVSPPVYNATEQLPLWTVWVGGNYSTFDANTSAISNFSGHVSDGNAGVARLFGNHILFGVGYDYSHNSAGNPPLLNGGNLRVNTNAVDPFVYYYFDNGLALHEKMSYGWSKIRYVLNNNFVGPLSASMNGKNFSSSTGVNMTYPITPQWLASGSADYVFTHVSSGAYSLTIPQAPFPPFIAYQTERSFNVNSVAGEADLLYRLVPLFNPFVQVNASYDLNRRLTADSNMVTSNFGVFPLSIPNAISTSYMLPDRFAYAYGGGAVVHLTNNLSARLMYDRAERTGGTFSSNNYSATLILNA
jgi:hypothetical protein